MTHAHRSTLIAISLISTVGLISCTLMQSLAQPEAPEKSEQAQSEIPTAEVPVDNSAWLTYENEELGITFQSPPGYTVNVGKEMEGDSGKMRNIFLSGHDLLRMRATSSDFDGSAGEGCCYFFPGDPINLSLSDPELKEEINKRIGLPGRVMNLTRVKVGGRNALRFYQTTAYVSSSVQESILLQLNRNGFANLLIQGPLLLQDYSELTTPMHDISEELEALIVGKKYLEQLTPEQAAELAEKEELFNRIVETIEFTESTPFIDNILGQLPDTYIISEVEYLESFDAEPQKAIEAKPCDNTGIDSTYSPLCHTKLTILEEQGKTASLDEYINPNEIMSWHEDVHYTKLLVEAITQDGTPFVFTPKAFMCIGNGGEGCMRKRFVYHLDDGRNIVAEISFWNFNNGKSVDEPIQEVQDIIKIYEDILVK